jgi:hypothetical protein
VFALLGGWRSVGYLLIAFTLGAALWWVQSRIERSYTAEAEAAVLQRDLQQKKLDINELRASVRIHEQEKASLARALMKNQDTLDRNIQKAVGRVKVIANPDPSCDLNVDIIGVLNAARRNDVPSAPIEPAPPAKAPPSD